MNSETRHPGFTLGHALTMALGLFSAACGVGGEQTTHAPSREVDIALSQLTAHAPGDAAAAPGPARLIAPLSGSIPGAARPALRWTGPRLAVVEICADRG